MRDHPAGNGGELVDVGTMAVRKQRAEPVQQQPGGDGPRLVADPPEILTAKEQVGVGAVNRDATQQGRQRLGGRQRRAHHAPGMSTGCDQINNGHRYSGSDQNDQPGPPPVPAVPRRPTAPPAVGSPARSGAARIHRLLVCPRESGRASGPATSGADDGGRDPRSIRRAKTKANALTDH